MDNKTRFVAVVEPNRHQFELAVAALLQEGFKFHGTAQMIYIGDDPEGLPCFRFFQSFTWQREWV